MPSTLSIFQGDTEYLIVSLVNLAALPTQHPLKAFGLLTPGYSLRLVAKMDQSRPDSLGLNLGPSRFTVIDSETAALKILPSDTADLAIAGSGSWFYCDIQVSNPDGSEVFTSEGRLFVRRQTAITAP